MSEETNFITKKRRITRNSVEKKDNDVTCHLPADIIRLIFEMLPIGCRFIMRRVCKLWTQSIDQRLRELYQEEFNDRGNSIYFRIMGLHLTSNGFIHIQKNDQWSLCIRREEGTVEFLFSTKREIYNSYDDMIAIIQYKQKMQSMCQERQFVTFGNEFFTPINQCPKEAMSLLLEFTSFDEFLMEIYDVQGLLGDFEFLFEKTFFGKYFYENSTDGIKGIWATEKFFLYCQLTMYLDQAGVV